MRPGWRYRWAMAGTMRRRGGWWLLGVLAVGGILLQLVPLGVWRQSNPPVIRQAIFADAVAEALAAGACLDCHSHQTRHPLYSRVAPMSWLIQRDVEIGREEMNLSDWHPDDGEDAAETVLVREMPPRRYTLLYPEARLTDDERRTLASAFQAMADAADDD